MMNDLSALAMLGGLIFVIVIIVIILYVFMALGMQSMAKKLQIENPWLAWIPIANIYLMGKIAGDQVTIFNKVIPKLGLVLLVGGIGVYIITFIPFINIIAVIVYAVIYIVALYKIYRIFSEDNAVIYTVLSVIIDVTAPFFIYFASKNQPNLAIFNEGKTSGFSPLAPETPPEDKIEE